MILFYFNKIVDVIISILYANVSINYCKLIHNNMKF